MTLCPHCHTSSIKTRRHCPDDKRGRCSWLVCLECKLPYDPLPKGTR